MKKGFILAIALVCTMFSAVNAQKSEFKGQLYIGAGAGPAFSTVDFQPRLQQYNLQRYSGGVAVKYISEANLGLIGEVNYTQRGWREKFAADSDFKFERTINYLEIPLMTHIYFGRKVRFIINLGPQISFMLGDSSDMNDALRTHIETQREEAPDEATRKRIGAQYNPFQRKVDYGLIGGMGMEFQTGIGIFNLEGRYYFGLGDMFDTSVANKDYFSRAANRVIGGRLTYYIPFK